MDRANTQCRCALRVKLPKGDFDRSIPMNFASDNTAGIAPRILEAIAQANADFALGYGNDAETRRVERRLSEHFEHDVKAFLVAAGTAANAITLAELTPPWGAVLRHGESHIVTDERGAPAFLGHAMRLVGLPGERCKLSRDRVAAALAKDTWGAPHHFTPAALSITQATEAGTISRPAEIAALADIAHARGLAVHMDGARLTNALVRLGVTPAEATWKAGIDVVSFGATKGGAMAAEAIVFFDPKRATAMAEGRKRGGHLLSKHRFVAAQFDAFLADDYGSTLARHANAMADRLAAALAAIGVPPVWPVEANLVFVLLPKALDARLREAGATYYVRSSGSFPRSMTAGADAMLVRLVTSFATGEAEIDRFVKLLRESLTA